MSEVLKYSSKVVLPQARGNPSSPALIDFSLKLLSKYVADDTIFVPEPSLIETAEILQRFSQQRNTNSSGSVTISAGTRPEDFTRVIEEIRLKLQSAEHASMGKQPQQQGPPQQSQATLPFSATKETEARNSMLSVLEEWLRLTGDPILNSEKARMTYITQIQHQGIISSDEISALFFRTGVEKRSGAYFSRCQVYSVRY